MARSLAGHSREREPTVLVVQLGGVAHTARTLALSPHASVVGPHIHFFSGKGGVGKSTIAAASALGAAQQGGPVLLVEMAGRQTVSRLFGIGPLKSSPTQIRAGLYGLSVDPIGAVQEYLEGELRMPMIARRLARGAFLGRFFEAAPAVFEVASLAKIERLSRSTNPRWASIYVDLEATGHAEMFLSLPKLFRSIAPAGPVRRVLDDAQALIADSERASLHVITGAEPVILEETRGFIARVIAAGDVPLRQVVINECEAVPISEDEEARLAEYRSWLEARGATGALEELGHVERALERREAQERTAEDLKQAYGVEVRLVDRLDDVSSRSSLESLAGVLRGEADDAHR